VGKAKGEIVTILARALGALPHCPKETPKTMNVKQRAETVRQRLEELYPDPPIPLDHKDPYTLLVAVLLSAQCTDKMVNRVTPDLWKLADTPEAMSRRSVEEILAVIRPLGLAPRKAKAIRELSQILVDKYAGQVPADMELLEELPGVGHKTASVVMCQAFGQPAFPVDTHIHRLAQRWGLSNGKNVEQTERDLKKLFPEESWNRLHLQIIYYGREHCTARTCDGTRCELCRTLYPKRR
jgi:endonuclease-3